LDEKLPTPTIPDNMCSSILNAGETQAILRRFKGITPKRGTRHQPMERKAATIEQAMQGRRYAHYTLPNKGVAEKSADLF